MADPRVRLKTKVVHADDNDLIGDTVEQISVFRSPDGSLVSFVTPSIAHLALDAGVRSARIANERRALVESTHASRPVFKEEVVHLADGKEHGARSAIRHFPPRHVRGNFQLSLNRKLRQRDHWAPSRHSIGHHRAT